MDIRGKQAADRMCPGELPQRGTGLYRWIVIEDGITLVTYLPNLTPETALVSSNAHLTTLAYCYNIQITINVHLNIYHNLLSVCRDICVKYSHFDIVFNTTRVLYGKLLPFFYLFHFLLACVCLNISVTFLSLLQMSAMIS